MSIIQEALKKVQTRSQGRRTSPSGGYEKRPDMEEMLFMEGLEKGFGPSGPYKADPRLAIILSSIIIVLSAAVIMDSIFPAKAHRNVLPAAAKGKVYPVTDPRVVVRNVTLQAPRPAVAEPIRDIKELEKLVPASPVFKLNGIMYLDSGAQAIINDAVLEEGDTIDGAKVSAINDKNVVLVYEGKEIRLSLR